MHRSKQLAAALAAGVAAVGMTACGSDNGGSAGGGGGGASKATKPSDVTVGVVLKTFANDYWTAMRDGVQAKAKELGVPVKIDAAASESGTDEQVSKLEAMASANYDCYAAAPITATNLIQPLVPLARDGKVIVDLDSPISLSDAKQAGVTPATFIASNHEQAGVLGAQQMAKELGAKASGAQIALIGGIAGDTTSNARLKGFKDTAATSGLKIAQTGNADWDREKALTLAGDILRSRPNLAGFFAANDTMALGIAQAVQNASKGGKVVIIGVDGAKPAEQAIKKGTMNATVAQFPYAVGSLGVEACVAAAQGKDIPTNVESPLSVVTKDNADKALAAYPAPFEDVADPLESLITK
ncbi:MAG: D-allose transport system substrate-binding protein [Solirubrobacteraceae bacterium]|nr:D-allose transport system substrate-binding protein [Solirubrobacteraceae bacterium]